MKPPKVSRQELLDTFDRMCKALGKSSKGFEPGKITGKDQWAMQYRKDCGWMIVCGLGGCGAALSRWNGYVQNRWDLMMLMEAVIWVRSR